MTGRPLDPMAAAVEAEDKAERLEALAESASDLGQRRRAFHYRDRARLLRESAAIYRWQHERVTPPDP